MQNDLLDAKLLQSIDDFIAANREAIINDIAALVAIDSVRGAAAPDAPFGEGPKAALQKTLDIAARLGLDAKNCDNYIGYAAIPGADSEKYLATICHVDVVPAGNGWDADPFTMRLQDGWLLGRGVADDKGPMVLTLYALAFLKNAGVPLRYGVRALAGAAEESGMEDVQWYMAHEPAPVFCFTPDAEFPVCNGEKGHFNGTIESPVLTGGAIVDFNGGVADNAVPDRAFALVKADIHTLPAAPYITLEAAGDGLVKVCGLGVAGHAAMPQNTRNAIGVVANYLLKAGVCSQAENAYLAAIAKLHAATDGSGLGIAIADEPFGPLTIIGGRIFMRDGKLVQTFDSRYPTNADGQVMAAAARQAIGEGADFVVTRDVRPFYISADSPAVKACIDTYNLVTGENAVPFTMGGGTYARHFPYAVSFGPEHADTVLPPFGGPMHGANEAAPLDKLLEGLKIYIVALLRLQQLDF